MAGRRVALVLIAKLLRTACHRRTCSLSDGVRATLRSRISHLNVLSRCYRPSSVPCTLKLKISVPSQLQEKFDYLWLPVAPAGILPSMGFPWLCRKHEIKLSLKPSLLWYSSMTTLS